MKNIYWLHLWDPLFSKKNKILIFCGNLVTWWRLKKNGLKISKIAKIYAKNEFHNQIGGPLSPLKWPCEILWYHLKNWWKTVTVGKAYPKKVFLGGRGRLLGLVHNVSCAGELLNNF